MPSHGSSPRFQEVSAVIASLKACAQRKDLLEGSKLHVKILAKDWLRRNVFVGSTLVRMYAACGAFLEAEEILTELHTQNVVPWNALIAGFAQHGQGKKALGWFEKMKENGVSPDSFTYSCILKACGSIAAIVEAREIHEEIARKGLIASNVVLANALVDAYVKCGMLPMAQEVLDHLPVRDVVAWTALIAGYCDNGQEEDALFCFDRLQQEGASPNGVTFTCTLKACRNIGAIDKGMDIHAEIVRKKLLESNCALGTALVDMYARNGALMMAQQVLNELPLCDEATWSALIAGCTCHMYDMEALGLFEQMCHRAISFNGVVLTCVLKACGSTRTADVGKLVHAIIVREDLLTGDGVLGNALVDMYAKCGVLAKAEAVLEELADPDRVSLTAFVSGCSQHGQDLKAINYLNKIRHEGLMADGKILLCILQSCSNIGALEVGKGVHEELIKTGYLGEDNILGIGLLHMYANCGALAKAQQVFNELPVQDIVSWNILISGYCKHGLGERALFCLELMETEGFSPDEATLLAVLQACGSIGATERKQEICSRIMDERWHEKCIFLGNALLDMFVKWGAVSKAHEVFDKLLVQDLVSWNVLLAGYCQNGLYQEAFNSLEVMQLEGFSPDGVTLSCLLKACSSLRALNKGKEMHAAIARQGLLEKDSVLGNTLVDMYAKCGALLQARQVFDRLTVKDTIGWTSLIAGYCQHGASNEGLNCFQEMKHEGVSLDIVTFACLLKACSTIGSKEISNDIHSEIERLGLLERGDMLMSALVDMHAKCGSMAKAQQIFDNHSSRNVITWTSLIAGYAQNGKQDAVFALLHAMTREGVEPNLVTFVVVLKACSHFGLVQQGHDVLQRMEVTLEHNFCMLDCYGRAGHLDKAMLLIEKLPLCDHSLAWFVLLGACQKMGHVEFGKLAFWPRRGIG